MSGAAIPRVVALVAAYNEERLLPSCIEHYRWHGVGVYVIDNESTDATRAIAERYLGAGVVGIESFPRGGAAPWEALLRRKEELAGELDADWFLHCDPDEVRLPPHSGTTLAAALAAEERRGFNAVNFLEFTFVPTRESPDHDHPRFLATMRWYYCFSPGFPWRLNAWKKTAGVELAASGGHLVSFPGLAMSPTVFPMRHYLFLSRAHAIEKYVQRRYLAAEVERGWHGWRARLVAEAIELPSQRELSHYTGDDTLDASRPRRRHLLDDALDRALNATE